MKNSDTKMKLNSFNSVSVNELHINTQYFYFVRSFTLLFPVLVHGLHGCN